MGTIADAFIPQPAQLLGSGLASVTKKLLSKNKKPNQKKQASQSATPVLDKVSKMVENFALPDAFFPQPAVMAADWMQDKFLNFADKRRAKFKNQGQPVQGSESEQTPQRGTPNVMAPANVSNVVKGGFTNRPAANDSTELEETETVKILRNSEKRDIELVEGQDQEIDILDALIEGQEETIELLKQIEANTKPNTLKDREDEIEARNRSRLGGLMGKDSANDSGKNGKGGLMDNIIGPLVEGAVQAWLGKKLIGGVFGGKGGAGGVAGAAKKPGIFSRIGGAVKSGGSALLTGAGKGLSALGTKGKALAGVAGAISAASFMKSAPDITPIETKPNIKPVAGAPVVINRGPAANDVAKPSLVSQAVDKSKVLASTIGEKAATVVDKAKVIGSSLAEKASGILSAGKQMAGSAGSTIAEKAGSMWKGAGDALGKGVESVKTAGKGIGSAAGKMLGVPLTAAMTLYDVNEVASNDNLNDTQKKKEYTKIGTKLAGMWAGAKAGAAVGAMGGGAVGAAFGGVGAAPGAAVGGILGGIAGAFGGAELGEMAGDKLGGAVFEENKNIKSPDNITVESVMPQPAKTTQVIQTSLRLGGDNIPKPVADYINNTSNSKFEDIKTEYYDYLNREGIKFDDNTAINAIAKVKQESLQHKAKIESLDKFSTLKYNDPKELIKKVSANQIQSLSPETTAKNMDDFSVGNTRQEFLSTISKEMETNIFEKMKPQPQAPIVINNNNSSGGSNNINNGDTSGNRSKLGIPSTRNQDGTIQRMLNNTYRPLMG